MASQGIQKRVGKRGVSYRVRVDFPRNPATGERERRSETLHNHDEAKALYARWSQEAKKAAAAPDKRKQTLNDWAPKWLASPPIRKLSVGTRRRYADLFKLYLLPLLGNYRLDRLSDKIIDAAYLELLETPRERTKRPLASKTANLAHNVLKSCMKAAIREGLILQNPVDLATAPPRPKPNVKCWKVEQTGRWLTLADQDEYHVMWRLFAHTGMRRGEVLGLKWDALDLARATLVVEGSRSRAERGSWADGETKSRRRRTIRLDADMVARLGAHQAEQHATKRDVGTLYDDRGYVFAQANGNPIHVNTLARRHAKLIAAAGVPYVRPHDLRHASATLGLESGETLKDVQERLGHSSAAITSDYYLHPSEERQRENADRLAEYLRKHEGA